MSTSNNLDQKALLTYITATLKHWGMLYITEDILKQAKKNDPDAINHLTRLLFDLVILHVFDFEYLPNELNIIFEDDQEMTEIVMAHLYESNCPMIVSYQEESQAQNVIGFDFSSSRHLLITCGWVMAISDFFNQTADKLVKKKFKQIYRPKPLNLGALSKKYTLPLARLNLHQTAPEIQRISLLAKTLKSRKYSVQCLIAKRNRLLRRIKQDLKGVDSGLTIEDIFSTSNSQQVQALENELREIIVFSKQNMNYRKYWWIWLDQKIISLSYQDLSSRFQDFQKLQVLQQHCKFSVQIDLDYPRKYVQKCQEYHLQLQSLSEQLEHLGLKTKKIYKDIDRDIIEEIKGAKERAAQQMTSVPSFIGMQLKNYMNVGIQVQQKDAKQVKKVSEKSSKRLKQSIRGFVAELEGIILL